MSEFGIPLIGDKAPEFKAQTTKGPVNFPKDYEGKWVVFFSHPGDFTPVCTTEFVSFAKNYDKFKEMNADLLGLSVDQVFSHMKWTEWIKEKLETEIPFPIVADNTGSIGRLYGMLQPEAKGAQTVRAVFVIDPKGVIRAIIYYPLSIGRNIEEILRLLKALQISDREGVALPANWPKNEIIGDGVIVPPATNESDAKERLKSYDCFDWWFCHKKLKG